jgi:tetratricopeptide (TPR) repeat protein
MPLNLLAVIFFGLCAVIQLVGFALRFVKHLRIRKHAKIHIGDEVSVHTDKGAKFAYKGICAYLSGDYSSALTHLERALKFSTVSQNNAFCLDWMSQCYDAQEKYEESLQCCVKAVQAEPTNIKMLFNLADMYVRRGRFDKAEFYYNRILNYDEDNIAACFMLGTLFMGCGEYERAEGFFLKALEIDGRFVAAMAEMSVLCAIKGDYSTMNRYYAEATDKQYIESDRLRERLDSIEKMQGLCNDCK